MIIKASGIEVSRNEKGDLLLTVGFRNLDGEKKEYSWMPKWSTLRQLLLSSIVVESINRPGSRELSHWDDFLTQSKNLKDDLGLIFHGQLGVEE